MLIDVLSLFHLFLFKQNLLKFLIVHFFLKIHTTLSCAAVIELLIPFYIKGVELAQE